MQSQFHAHLETATASGSPLRAQLSQLAEDFVLDFLKGENPDWVTEGGDCTRCEEVYDSLDEPISLNEFIGMGE